MNQSANDKHEAIIQSPITSDDPVRRVAPTENLRRNLNGRGIHNASETHPHQ